MKKMNKILIILLLVILGIEILLSIYYLIGCPGLMKSSTPAAQLKTGTVYENRGRNQPETTKSENQPKTNFRRVDGKEISSREFTTANINTIRKEINGKKIFIPNALPPTNYQFIGEETQIELSKETLFFGQYRWDEEAEKVLGKMQEFGCLEIGYSIVDLGGGTGYYSLLFSQFVGSTGRVYLVEVNNAILDNALQVIRYNNYLEKIKGTGVNYLNIIPVLSCIDISFLPIESVNCVFVCEIHVFHRGITSYPPNEPQLWNVEESKQKREQILTMIRAEQGPMIKDIYSVLKPGGCVVMIENMTAPGIALRLDRGGIKQLFEGFGFKLIADLHDLENPNRDRLKNVHFLIFQKPK